MTTYADEAFADGYFGDRAITEWGDVADKPAALLRATSYLDGRYRGRWKGVKTDLEQALAWPRKGARDEDGILIEDDVVPLVVRQACCEAALRIGRGDDLTPDLDRGGRIKRERVKAGPVEGETEYADNAPARAAITAIDDLLRGVIRGGAGVWLERV